MPITTLAPRLFDLPPEFWRRIRERLYGSRGPAVERNLRRWSDENRFARACAVSGLDFSAGEQPAD